MNLCSMFDCAKESTDLFVIYMCVCVCMPNMYYIHNIKNPFVTLCVNYTGF